MTGLAIGVAFLMGAWFGLAAVVAAACLGILAVSLKVTRLLPVVIVLFAGFAGFARVDSVEDQKSAVILEPGPAKITGVVQGFPLNSSTGQRFEIVSASSLDSPSATFCALAPALPLLQQGMTVRATAELLPAFDASRDTRAFLRARGCSASANVSEVIVLSTPSGLDAMLTNWRMRIAGTLQRASPGDAGALMTGLVTGDDSALSARSRRDFLDTGTTHITAVSGANFALIVLLAAALGGTPAERSRWRWLTLTAITIWIYAILVGLPPSAFRAGILATLVLLSARTGRRPDLLTLTFIAGAIQIFIRPVDLHSVAFQLSFASTVALVLVFSGIRRRFDSVALAAFVSVVVAHLATVPLVLATFGEVSTAAIPANIAIAPLVFVGFPLAAVAGFVGIISSDLGESTAIPASMFSRSIIDITRTIADASPGRIAFEEPPSATMALIVLLCWTAILALSQEPRTIWTHATAWWKSRSTEMLIPAIGFGTAAGATAMALVAFR